MKGGQAKNKIIEINTTSNSSLLAENSDEQTNSINSVSSSKDV